MRVVVGSGSYPHLCGGRAAADGWRAASPTMRQRLAAVLTPSQASDSPNGSYHRGERSVANGKSRLLTPTNMKWSKQIMSIPQGRPRAPSFETRCSLKKWLLALLLTCFATPQNDGARALSSNNCQIYNEQGACSVIVDFFRPAQSYPDPAARLRSAGHRFSRMWSTWSTATPIDTGSRSAVRRCGSARVCPPIFADQIDQLRDDLAVRPVTDTLTSACCSSQIRSGRPLWLAK